jgi:ABC-type multidrug transport system ATPase subunit
VVLGQNGSGKSTLLKVLASLIAASEGTVYQDVPDVRTGLGYAALDLALYPHLTVSEQLEFAGAMRGCSSRAVDLLEYVGLGDSKSVFANQLSSGMRARLRIALALQAEPPILILDEPGASLDEAGRALVKDVCERQRTRGCLILATNDPLERRFGTHELDLSSSS